MGASVLMVGTFDTKGEEFHYLRDKLLYHGINVISMNTGTMETSSSFPIDIHAEQVAEAGGVPLSELLKRSDRGVAVTVMGTGAEVLADNLYRDGKICGVIGMGGGGGTSIATAAMQKIPIGVPKLCITTMASGDTRPYIGGKDILLFPSIVDICGLNSFSKQVLSNAAAAMAGLISNMTVMPESVVQKNIMISMFGNTTAAGTQCVRLLKKRGFETLVFHAVGTGGRSLEDLTACGYAHAVLDLTTTEWADELCGGMYSAGPSRLDAPGKAGIPHLIVPGCIDMVNFGPMDTVPERYRTSGRTFFQWSPQATLMRTNLDENAELGKVFVQKAISAPKTTAFLIPTGGFSELGRKGGPFWAPDADNAFIQALTENLSHDIRLETVQCNINDPEFAVTAVAMLLEMMSTDGKET